MIGIITFQMMLDASRPLPLLAFAPLQDVANRGRGKQKRGEFVRGRLLTLTLPAPHIHGHRDKVESVKACRGTGTILYSTIRDQLCCDLRCNRFEQEHRRRHRHRRGLQLHLFWASIVLVNVTNFISVAYRRRDLPSVIFVDDRHVFCYLQTYRPAGKAISFVCVLQVCSDTSLC